MSAAPHEHTILTFDNNALLPALFGPRGANLARIETALQVSLTSRGNQVAASGASGQVAQARAILQTLYQRLEAGAPLEATDVEDALRTKGEWSGDPIAITTPRRRVTARTPAQAACMRAMRNHDLTLSIGPAGTGKTWLAVCHGVMMLINGHVERIILSRPAVEAGERLGFLPGDMKEKVDPYFRPIYDALYEALTIERTNRLLATGAIEIAPLAFMRGRTLSNAFILLDEAQNATPAQMKMMLTRLGENSRMVVTGDPSQVDLPPGQTSGLEEASGILTGMTGAAIVRFHQTDVMRHPLVARIVAAYAAAADRKSKTRTKATAA